MKRVRMSKALAEQLDFSQFTWRELGLVVRALWTEMKRRNPIGIGIKFSTETSQNLGVAGILGV